MTAATTERVTAGVVEAYVREIAGAVAAPVVAAPGRLASPRRTMSQR
jgi:hypothetical protein